MIDPLLSLSFNLHSQRGSYALLLGSGVSRSASIPTGWEVTLDLVRKVAHLSGDKYTGTEVDWYRSKFGTDPDYSQVLTAIAPKSAAQQQLLKHYFEPTDEERADGKKLPTLAHKAIAQLVSGGHVRVIVTTNFDRLVEAALEAEGVAPIVVASADAALGAPPLAHSKCTVIKVHGDYLDHRIKNSPSALAKYDRATDRLLDQVFNEYGLIICGWSADYDVALRKALERSKSRRYPLYWTGLSPLSGASKDLAALHEAHFVGIAGADQFFTELLDKVEALEEFDRPHPLTTQAAVISLKRFLSEPRFRIQLHDFLIAEAQRTRSGIEASYERVKGVQPDKASAQLLMTSLESSCEKLIHLFAAGAFHANRDQGRPFFDAFNTVPTAPDTSDGYQVWSNLRQYPLLLLVYAAGIASVASENYSVLRELAERPTLTRRRGQEKSIPPPAYLNTHNVMERDHGRAFIDGMERRYTPMSDHLFSIMREPLRAIIPQDDLYALTFDNFEYLWCLLNVDAQKQLAGHVSPPYGSFIWRRKEYDADWFAPQLEKGIIPKGESGWPPLAGGLFGGSFERLSQTYKTAKPMLVEIASQMD